MHELQRYLVDEFVEDYEQGRLTRRQALRLIAGLTGAALAAQMLDARAQQAAAPGGGAPPGGSIYRVAPDDASIVAASIRFPGSDGEMLGYLARPAGSSHHPIVLVCHENRGLTRHIEDVTRRLAKAGYLGLAVDLVSREGGTGKQDPDRIPGLLGRAPPARHVQDFQSGLSYAKSQPFALADRAGMVGFCFGGGVTWRVAAAIPELRAAVPFYGVPVPPGDAPKVNAAVLAIYAGRDNRINQNIPTIEAAMKQSGKTFRAIVYPDVDHGFHSDTSDSYDAAAAKAAWEETLAWFGRYLQPA